MGKILIAVDESLQVMQASKSRFRLTIGINSLHGNSEMPIDSYSI